MAKRLSERIIEVDTHTHTILSGHAWSTLSENCAAAAARGMKGLCLTEHGPALINGAPDYLPHSQRMVPEYVDGIHVWKGMEINILNPNGDLDVPENYISLLEFGIASFHHIGGIDIVIGNETENTDAYLKVLQNPYIDTLGHADEPKVPCDLEAIVLEAKKFGKLNELNNNRIASGIYDCTRMKEYALLCKKHDQRVCIGSDTHFHTMVGNVRPMLNLLESIDFPPELIVNLTYEGFEAYLAERKERIAKLNNGN